MNKDRSAKLILLALLLGVLGTACQPASPLQPAQTETPAALIEPGEAPSRTASHTPTPTIVETPALTPDLDTSADCTTIERLPPDSAEAQQVVEGFVTNYKEQYPTEYMGMAILNGVYRLGEWAVVIGSIAGEGTDVVAVRQTPIGYQLSEQMHIPPLEAPGELDDLVIQPLVEKLTEAPAALFTCMNLSWLQPPEHSSQPVDVFQLVYVGTEDGTTEGVSEVKTVRSDGSNPGVLLHEPMLITGIALAPDGERIAFWGCPGNLANDCLPDEDLDVWVLYLDGTNLGNLTEDSAENDSHPDWSPDGRQIVFDSWRSGKAEIYVMNSDGSNPHAITNGPGENTEPKWSPDGNWIAYHCSQAGETRICIVSPEGQSSEESISGTMPVWSPAGTEDGVQLAFLCYREGQSDICTSNPDSSDIVHLTDDLANEHSMDWSPDGNWLAFISNRGEDIDIYKICVTCPEERVAIRLTDEVRFAMWPAWSPDGSQLAYVDEPGGSLLVVNADRSGVTYLAGGVFSPPAWLP